MNLKAALDSLEDIPGCLSACLLTAKGELVTGRKSAQKADSMRSVFNKMLKINTIFRSSQQKKSLSGAVIMNNRKKILFRFTGKASERVLLAIELASGADEKKIKLGLYSLFESE